MNQERTTTGSLGQAAICPGHPGIAGLPTGRSLLLLAVVYAALMAYGSFVPLHFEPLSRSVFEQRLQQMQDLWVIDSRIDFTANVLLGIPLGFLLLGAWSLDRGRRRAVGGLLAVLPVCLAFSAMVEVGQTFFPPRAPSLNDIAAQQLGVLIGGLLWIAVGQKMSQWCRELGYSRAPRGRASRWLPVYILILVAVHLMPLDLAVRPHELWAKWKAGGIQLVPQLALGNEPFERVRSLFGAAAYFVPLGFLWTLARPRQSGPLRALGFGLAIAVCLEGAQLFVASRTTSTLDALLGGLGTLLGYAAATVYQRRQGAFSASSLGPGDHLRWAGVAATLVWLGVLVVDHWYPFQFQGDGVAVRQRFTEVPWIPLADYVAQPWGHALDELVQRIVLFFVLGAVAAVGWPQTSRRANRMVLGGILATALVLEGGQLWLPTRYFGFTDLLMEWFGGFLGLWVMRRWALPPVATDAWPRPTCRQEQPLR